ncbi:MAG: hypothetical protein HY270_11660, partial [Deltaproteobacteria bacterium]|nr:hypothetical protein [Deltaproteobacteria bacterium]
MLAQVELRGGRIRLRDLARDDCYDIFDYASDPIVTHYAGWEPHESPADSLAYIERCLGEDWTPITFAIEHIE